MPNRFLHTIGVPNRKQIPSYFQVNSLNGIVETVDRIFERN